MVLIMKKLLLACLTMLCFNISVMAKDKTVTLHLLETSDVHGCFFPYDFINNKPSKGSLARVSTYVRQLREQGGQVILLDNGDILQGQPVCYYYNYIKTNVPNIAAEVVNYLGYDAQTMGNHDVETGHAVYDKWTQEVKCPMLGANIINTATGQPYLPPYTIIERQGVKVAVLGMITPAIPNWLKEQLWQGLRFDEMVSTARQWAKYIKEHEKPDVLVGLFHSGWDGGIRTADYDEDATRKVTEQIPGFDVIFFGHDHTPRQETVGNVLCLDPANNAMRIAEAELQLVCKNGKWTVGQKNGKLVEVGDLPVDEQYMAHFQPQIDSVKAYVNRKVGTLSQSLDSKDCFFGSSALTDLIQDLQLSITGADISFTAPLTFNTTIPQGDITVGEMFNLYKYENQLYVMRMTGEEIRKHLEMSYDLWCNTMTSPDDHLLLLNAHTYNDQQRMGFKNFSFNFDSATGIDYEVDVTKPDGQKVRILQLSNGQPFDEGRWYRVAVNSYRGNGGGELLTKGAGIPRDSLQGRIVWESEKDQRYYLMQEIERLGTINPKAHNNWRFVPEAWTKPAAERDRKLLFGEEK